MDRSIRLPAVVLVVGLLALGAAALLDTGGEGSRDAALLVGTAALWVVAGAAVWLVMALVVTTYRRRQLQRR